jgi:uncharacterized protein (DUF2267 family)
MEAQEMITWVAERSGVGNAFDARRAIRATLAELGEQVPAERRDLVANVLPRPFKEIFLAHHHRDGIQADDFFDHVQRREATNRGYAREHAEVVCKLLGALMDENDRARLVRDLDPDLGALFVPTPRAYAPPPPHGRRSGGPAHTLASARPGSLHPLSEARPPGAQTHSVVNEDNPHGETKLSSAHGTTQERLERSLAEARPDSARTIAEASDRT